MLLNVNMANTKLFHGIVPALLQTKEAVMGPAILPIANREGFKSNLAVSHYRHNQPSSWWSTWWRLDGALRQAVGSGWAVTLDEHTGRTISTLPGRSE
jgi:uncharacterized membrane protein